MTAEGGRVTRQHGIEFGGGRLVRGPGEAGVADAMVRRPKLLPATASSGDVRGHFGDHVHMALVVEEERLLTVIERHDVEGSVDGPARGLGTLLGRTIPADADLWDTWMWMTETGRRRLAVVDDGRCVGLLCLKRSGLGFCCDAGVRARHLTHQELTWDE